MRRNERAKCEQADAWWHGKAHKFYKRRKRKLERRRARLDVECTPGYKFYRGYES